MDTRLIGSCSGMAIGRGVWQQHAVHHVFHTLACLVWFLFCVADCTRLVATDRARWQLSHGEYHRIHPHRIWLDDHCDADLLFWPHVSAQWFCVLSCMDGRRNWFGKFSHPSSSNLSLRCSRVLSVASGKSKRVLPHLVAICHGTGFSTQLFRLAAGSNHPYGNRQFSVLSESTLRLCPVLPGCGR